MERQNHKWWNNTPSYEQQSAYEYISIPSPQPILMDENFQMQFLKRKFTRGAALWKKFNAEA